MAAATAKTTAKQSDNTFTVFRRQVIQTGSYEPSEASCSVTISLNGEDDMNAVAALISEWGTTLDIANYEALGLPYEMEEGGIRRLEKSLPGPAEAAPVAYAPPGNTPPPAAGTKDAGWRDLMDNKASWFDPNWQKKLDGSFTNMKSPDYKHKTNGQALWMTKPSGDSQVPSWFICPFTGKNADELTQISLQLRA